MDIDLEDDYTTESLLENEPEKPKLHTPPLKKPKPQKKLSPQEVFYRAVSNYRNQKYVEAVNLLIPFVEEYEYHIMALKLLGISLIETGRLEDAAGYLQSAFKQNRNDPETLNALAYLELINGRNETGITYLLDAVYLDEENDKLKRNLERVRAAENPALFLKMGKAYTFLFINLPDQPPLREFMEKAGEFIRKPVIRYIIIGLVAGLAGILLYFLAPTIVNILEAYRMERSGVSFSQVTIKDIEKLVAERENYKILLSAAEVEQKFNMVKYYLENKERNKAVITINEILNSNAHEQVKEHVIILQSFIPDPNPDSLGYIPDCREVVKRPLIYKDVYVKWNGTVANLQHKGHDETAFDLLINFVDEGVVDGIALVTIPGWLDIRNKDKVAVYGTIAGIQMDNRVVIIGDHVAPIGKQ
jgi:tetratricopeptide (TPR) repeat protein